MKLPEQYVNEDWFSYLHASAGRQGKSLVLEDRRRHAVRAMMDTNVESGVDAYQLILGLDLLVLDEIAWSDPYRNLAPGHLLYKLRKYNRSDAFWRGVFFSRYARSPIEVMSYWRSLAALNSVEDGTYLPAMRAEAEQARKVLEGLEAEIRKESWRKESWLLDPLTRFFDGS